MPMEEIVKFIKEVGFPIFVAVYLLVRIERALLKMTDMFASLKALLEDTDKK
jgi:hypothetical protein